MAELKTLARPYAKAAYRVASSNGELSVWSDALAMLEYAISEPKLNAVIIAPAKTSNQKAELLIGVCNGSLADPIKNFIRILAQNQRLLLLAEIRQLFEIYKAEKEQTLDVEVSCAFPLSSDMEQKLRDALCRRLERNVSLQSLVDESLIGGAVIRAGDTVIDGSIRGRLGRLAETIVA